MNSEFQYVHETSASSQWRWIDELLEGQLVEAVGDVLLERDDALAVRDRLRRVAVTGGTRKLVDQAKAEPDCHLAPQVSPPTRQIAPPSCNHRRHDFSFYKGAPD